jgi:hypothetical protein
MGFTILRPDPHNGRTEYRADAHPDPGGAPVAVESPRTLRPVPWRVAESGPTVLRWLIARSRRL